MSILCKSPYYFFRFPAVMSQASFDLENWKSNTFQVKSRVVHTKYGRVQGFGARVGRDAQQQRYVDIFLGIPFASPPVGNYR